MYIYVYIYILYDTPTVLDVLRSCSSGARPVPALSFVAGSGSAPVVERVADWV